MCGRLSLSAADHRAAAELLSAAVAGFDRPSLANWLARADYQARTNVGPGQHHWLVRARRQRPILDRALWGMPARGPSRARLVINARAETITERPMFRAAFADHRCLIPADGFFEWDKRDGARQPHWFHRPDRSALLFAAIVEPPTTPEDPGQFAIITRPASPELSWIHDRMPAIIEPSQVPTWLHASADHAHQLLAAQPPALASKPVSQAFNHATYNGPLA